MLAKVSTCLVMCFLLLTLGTWQVFRLREKLQIIENMQAPATVVPPSDQLRAYAYHRVRLYGTFERQSYLNVFAGRMGYYFLQPFKLLDGRYILVNRGVLPLPEGSEALDGQKMDMEIQSSIMGVLYCETNSRTRWFIRNNAEDNLWFWFDVQGMSKYVQLPLESCIVWGDKSAALKGARPNDDLKVRNDHLEYAVTWYTLAVIWICGCVHFIRSRYYRGAI